MSDKVFLGSRVSDLDTGGPTRISRVNLLVDSEVMYTAGDDSGRTVEKTCPWGTQAMADSILARLRGAEYRPYTGLDGLLDPAAEVGDGITVGGTYSVLAQTDIIFDRHCTADVSAPGGDELEDEYPYKSRDRRQADRERARIYSVITKTAREIRLLVADEVRGLEGKLQLTATSLSSQITSAKEGLESQITQTASSLTSQITNTKEGLESKITQTAASLTSQITSTKEGLESKITQTAGELHAAIVDAENGAWSDLQLAASSLQSQIINANGDISTLQQTASSLSTRISSAEGNISTLEQTATSLKTRISSAEGDISSLEQTATSLRTRISNAEGDISSLEQTVGGFRLTVSNGTDGSTLQLMSGSTVLSSKEIYFTGMVTFSDLSGNGTTVINGGNISTGTIDASSVNVTNEFALYSYGRKYGYMGCGYGYDGYSTTYGAMLSDASGKNYIIAANSGARMEDASGGAIWVTGGNCFSSTDMMTYSDRRLKADIDHDLECYQEFFRALRPCRFLMAANPAEGYHTGFIAQEVGEAMAGAKLSGMDFAGLGEIKLPDGETRYALRYSEFIALNTYMIQELERRVAALEKKLEEMSA